MKNTLACLEGSIQFNEDVQAQTVNVISFRTGQQITINRDRLAEGSVFYEHISQQIDGAAKVFNHFNLVKMDKMHEGSPFTETLHIVYNFLPSPGATQRFWQVTYACLLPNNEIMNFTTLYPDENSMNNESGRLQHCVKSFLLNTL